MRRQDLHLAILHRRHFDAQGLQQRRHRLDVRQPWRIGQRQGFFRQQRCRHQRQRGILCPGNRNLATEGFAARDHNGIHTCLLFLFCAGACRPRTRLRLAFGHIGLKGRLQPIFAGFGGLVGFTLGVFVAHEGGLINTRKNRPERACTKGRLSLIPRSTDAVVAQWQSTPLVRVRSRVQSSLTAPSFLLKLRTDGQPCRIRRAVKAADIAFGFGRVNAQTGGEARV